MFAIIAGIVAVFLWALAPGFIKTGMNTHDFSWFLLIRYVLSTALVICVLPAVVRKLSQIKKSTLIATALSIAIHNGCQVYCLQEVSIFWYTLFFSLTPVLTVFFFEKPSWYVFTCFCFAIGGTFMILDPTGLPVVPAPIYTSALLICVLSWVILTVLLKTIHQTYDDMETTFILNFSNLISALFIWGRFGLPMESFTSQELVALVALVVSSPIALWLFSYSIRHNPLFGIGAQYLEIVFGVTISTLIYDETINTSGWLGGAIIILSIMLITFRKNITMHLLHYKLGRSKT